MIDSYNKLTLAAWEKIAALDNRTFEEDIDRQVAVLSILDGRSEAELLKLPLPEYIALVPKADFLFKEPKPSTIASRGLRRLKLDDTVLVPTTDLRKITTAQYIDFQTLLQQKADIAQLLSCFLVPEGKEYCDGYDIGEIHTLLAETLTVPDALSLRAFFLRKFSDSMRNILTSSQLMTALAPRKARKEMRRKIREMRDSLKNGGGSMPSGV